MKRLEEQFRESQRGALHNFFPTSNSVLVPDDNVVDAPNIEEVEQQVDDNPADAPENENLHPSSQPENSIDDVQEASIHDVFDPRTWENLVNKGRDILIEKGRVRELNLEFLVDALS